MSEDKRKHPRKRKMAVVHFTVPGIAEETYGVLRDICSGGMQISFNRKLEDGSRVEFLRTESLPCRYGYVRWCNKKDDLYLVGIEFADAIRSDGTSAPFVGAAKK